MTAWTPVHRKPTGLGGFWNVFVWTFGFDAVFLSVHVLMDSAIQAIQPHSKSESSFGNFDVLLAYAFIVLNIVSLYTLVYFKLMESPPVMHRILALAILLPLCGGLSALFDFRSRREAIVRTAIIGKLCADLGWFIRGCIDGQCTGTWGEAGPFGRSTTFTVLVVLLAVIAAAPYPATIKLFFF